MQFSLTNTGITILFVEGFTHGRGYSLLTEKSIVLRFYGQSTHWGHIERGQFTYPHIYWAGLVL